MKIDFHTHILPGIDDGSSSVEESIQLLTMEKAQGVERVVLTPHFYPQDDRPERFLQRRQNAFENLMESIDDTMAIPQLILGAEVYYFNGISQWDGLKKMCIGDTKYILLEMPIGKWTDRMYDEIEDIYRLQGLIPIIAHLDRYINIFNAKSILSHLDGMNIVIQANGSFFTDKKSAKLALKLLQNNVINILGSDCHNIDSRKPNLLQAEEIILQKLGQEYIDYVNKTGEDILSENKRS